MAKTTATVNSNLVKVYTELATGLNATEWDFMRQAIKCSVSVRVASIKQAQKESGVALPNITHSSAENLDTLAVILKAFPEAETEISFKRGISLARSYDRAGTAEGRAFIKVADSLDEVIESAPKRKGAGARVEKATEGDWYAELFEKAQKMETADALKFAEKLVSLAKAIRADKAVA